MSHSPPVSMSPSPEFIALCETQIALLTQELQAAWGIVYLTKGWVNSRETQLIPVVVYPSKESVGYGKESNQELPKIEIKNSSPLALLGNNLTEIEDKFTSSYEDHTKERQVILPLVYEQKIMGLLVTRRNEREWNEQEIEQIAKIAQTLALACFLDQRQKWYEKQLQEQNEQKELERDRLDNLLHQLRNPLTALRTFGKLLLKRFLQDESNQPIIKGILRESDRLQELLEEFEAEIAQKTQDTPTIELLPEDKKASSVRFLLPSSSVTLESISVIDLIDPLISSAKAIAQEKKITFISDIPTNLPLVQANSKALREVLSNLIDNALKYTPEEGKVTITVELFPTTLKILISDTGYGIPKEDLDHLFERHYRGIQAQGTIPGTGLGLAIAHELIEQMGGEIEVMSPISNNPNLPGTTFTVCLKRYIYPL
ncbi:histidine kinase [Aphanothece hegewaldii CCALA 016]|uniref:histidine kinase n=1 Tax=Aphanothece hegewaldii CCALA 016 TaxID=2107694 RepID=A0A2T1LWQ0_9CHRO|nr:GAF domain-containing sensor histidine kinase [Aphanothece hegewaldii]PSF36582.1 histidine kinase [Aphanothece hegewaldii CCALA 016]